jgi:hypothetical protein
MSTLGQAFSGDKHTPFLNQAGTRKASEQRRGRADMYAEGQRSAADSVHSLTRYKGQRERLIEKWS